MAKRIIDGKRYVGTIDQLISWLKLLREEGEAVECPECERDLGPEAISCPTCSGGE